jgi:hypothetical protein
MTMTYEFLYAGAVHHGANSLPVVDCLAKPLPHRIKVNISQERQYPQEKNAGRGEKKERLAPGGKS